jgi:GNAT superfamily N-acetyltransferase
MDVPIRLAREDELDAVSALIARSFHAEPFMAWVSGGDPERLARFAALAVRRVADDVLVDDGLTTAALVVRPGGLDIAPLEQLRMLPALVRSAGLRRLPAVLRALIRLEREHPEVPHATLIALGVEPAEQARGRGSAMLAAVERHAGVPVYLETGSEHVRDGCRRRGYATCAELRLAGGGPRIWTLMSGQAAGAVA